jgi:hypothetical protein
MRTSSPGANQNSAYLQRLIQLKAGSRPSRESLAPDPFHHEEPIAMTTVTLPTILERAARPGNARRHDQLMPLLLALALVAASVAVSMLLSGPLP